VFYVIFQKNRAVVFPERSIGIEAVILVCAVHVIRRQFLITVVTEHIVPQKLKITPAAKAGAGDYSEARKSVFSSSVMEWLKAQALHLERSRHELQTCSEEKKKAKNFTTMSMVCGMVFLKDHASRLTDTHAISENRGE
jgi:hypothetical protein